MFAECHGSLLSVFITTLGKQVFLKYFVNFFADCPRALSKAASLPSVFDMTLGKANTMPLCLPSVCLTHVHLVVAYFFLSRVELTLGKSLPNTQQKYSVKIYLQSLCLPSRLLCGWHSAKTLPSVFSPLPSDRGTWANKLNPVV